MDEATRFLLSQGVLGVVVLGMAYALVKVYQDARTAHEKSATTAATALEVIRSVREENKELSELVRALSSALKQTPSNRS